MGALFSSPASNYRPDRDIPNLKGKVVIVTGGNTGIGYQTVKELVKHGARVYLGARNESRATGAIAQLKSEGALDVERSGEVIWLPMDLTTPEGSRSSAEDFLRREKRLDILINNAALTTDEGMELVEGARIPISKGMAVNHLGPFVLTTTLLPLLKATAQLPDSDVRIVNVSSTGYRFAPTMDFKSYEAWDFRFVGIRGFLKAYGATKLANVLHVKELQRRFDAEEVPIIAVALHPGEVSTENVLKTFKAHFGFLAHIFFFFFQTQEMGGYNSLFAATSPTVRKRKAEFAGAYLVPLGKVEALNKVAVNVQAAKDLWETSERAARDM